MAKKATTRPARTSTSSAALLEVCCVYRVGTNEFNSKEEADAFAAQNSLRGKLEKLAAAALAKTSPAKRAGFRPAAEFLINAICSNPDEWSAAFGGSPSAAAPEAKASAKKAAKPTDPAKPKRKRRTKAEMLAAIQAKASGREAEANVASPPTVVATAGTLPPPPL